TSARVAAEAEGQSMHPTGQPERNLPLSLGGSSSAYAQPDAAPAMMPNTNPPNIRLQIGSMMNACAAAKMTPAARPATAPAITPDRAVTVDAFSRERAACSLLSILERGPRCQVSCAAKHARSWVSARAAQEQAVDRHRVASPTRHRPHEE